MRIVRKLSDCERIYELSEEVGILELQAVKTRNHKVTSWVKVIESYRLPDITVLLRVLDLDLHSLVVWDFMLLDKNSHSLKVVLKTTSKIVENVSDCQKEGQEDNHARIPVIVVVLDESQLSVYLRRLVLVEHIVISYFGNFLQTSITTKLFVLVKVSKIIG